ncbi:hypothetical protein STEG23_010862, partial [Scotinomys teguina]
LSLLFVVFREPTRSGQLTQYMTDKMNKALKPSIFIFHGTVPVSIDNKMIPLIIAVAYLNNGIWTPENGIEVKQPLCLITLNEF